MLFGKIDGLIIEPLYLQPEEFRRSLHPNSSVHDLFFLLAEAPFSEDVEISTYRDRLREPVGEARDNKWWRLIGNSVFTVKSFYSFLNDGGLCCPIARFFWRNTWPKKINIFNWLVWKDKSISLENLGKRRCNWFPTTTCVLCHSAIKSVDHLFLQCPITRQVWGYFVRLLHLPDLPMPMQSIWGSWRLSMRPSSWDMGDLVVKAIVWNI